MQSTPRVPRPVNPAKRYLQEYRAILLRADRLSHHLEAVWESSTRATSRLTATRLSGTGFRDGIANAAVELADGEAALKTEIEHLREALQMRLFLIGRLKDERHKAILTARYIDGMRWEDIARAMHYERSWLMELHGQALAEFTCVFKRADKTGHLRML